MAKLLLEEVHSKNTVDISGVVTEKDTTEGSEAAKHVPPYGDGGLDLRNVSGHFESLIELTVRLLC
jgi:F420-0:gamma-glutamyl ligase-like protein